TVKRTAAVLCGLAGLVTRRNSSGVREDAGCAFGCHALARRLDDSRHDADIVQVGADANGRLAAGQHHLSAVGKFDVAADHAALALEHIFGAVRKPGRKPTCWTHWFHPSIASYRTLE